LNYNEIIKSLQEKNQVWQEPYFYLELSIIVIYIYNYIYLYNL